MQFANLGASSIPTIHMLLYLFAFPLVHVDGVTAAFAHFCRRMLCSLNGPGNITNALIFYVKQWSALSLRNYQEHKARYEYLQVVRTTSFAGLGICSVELLVSLQAY